MCIYQMSEMNEVALMISYLVNGMFLGVAAHDLGPVMGIIWDSVIAGLLPGLTYMNHQLQDGLGRSNRGCQSPWWPLLGLLSRCTIFKSSNCNYPKIGHSTGARSSNVLQRLDFMTGYQDSSPRAQFFLITYPTMCHFVTAMCAVCTFMFQNGAFGDIFYCILGFVRLVEVCAFCLILHFHKQTY